MVLSIATLSVVALIALPSFAQGRPPDFREFEKVVPDELKETNTPGAAVAIVSGNRIIYAKGFGIANIETGAPVTPDMLFFLASTTLSTLDRYFGC